MSYLLGTQALSDQLSADPDDPVNTWVAGLSPQDKLFISVVSIGELLSTAEQHPNVVQRQNWRDRLNNFVPTEFSGLILPVSDAIARRWSTLRFAQTNGEPISTEESLLVATAQVHGLTYVTEETEMLRMLGMRSFNPWTHQVSSQSP